MATVIPPPKAPPEPPGDILYEVVDGQIMELPPMGSYATEIATVLVGYLAPFARTRGLGKILSEMLFRIDPPKNLQRRPDVSFVSDERWPFQKPSPVESPWDIVPDLAVEVVSPSNTANEVLAKVDEYFGAGVRFVWVVYPENAAIYIYESSATVRILRRGDVLECDPLLPGFRLSLAELFGSEAP